MEKVTLPSPSTLLRQWNKRFSAPALLKRIRADFGQVTDPRSGGQEFSLPDVLMSGLAVFGLKYPSWLKFDEQRHEARIRANLRSLYGVVQAPCDTQMRTVLDRVAPGAKLAPLIDFHEGATPLSQAAFVKADLGAMYGLEMSAERLKHPALSVRTPVPGLLLAGQDAVSPGLPGAFMGGFMAAASIEPRLWWEFNR